MKTDAEILTSILDKTRYTAHSLYKEINKNFPEKTYKSASTVYRILDGYNNMSYGFKARLLKTIPNLNPNYLDTGDGEILQKYDVNEISLIDLQKIPDRLDRIESMLEEILNKLNNN